MPEGTRLSKEELKARFGLSSRAVIRIGALLSRKVLVTEALLEAARPGAPMERLLLDPRLLEGDAAPNDRRLAEVRADLARDGAAVEEVCAVAQGGETVLALREEVLADSGFSEPAPPVASGGALDRRADPSPVAFHAQIGLPDMIGREESHQLFPPQEIGRLKLVVATGVDPQEKIEALRKISYSPLPPSEKGMIFMRALTDDSPMVRRESAVALRSLGLRPEITEAIHALSGDARESRLFAVDRLSVLLREAPASDRGVILLVLLTVLRHDPDVEIQSRVVSSLVDFSDLLVADREGLRGVVSLLVERLVTQFDVISRPVQLLLEAMGKAATEPVTDILWSEFERTTARRLRSFLLHVLARIPAVPRLRARLGSEIALQLRDASEADPDSRRLTGDLRLLGVESVEPLLRIIPETPEGERALLLRCLDEIASDPELPALYVNRVGRAVAQFLMAARKTLRLVMLEFRFFGRPELQSDVRAGIAADLIEHVHEYELDQIRDATDLALKRLGLPAVDPLLKHLKGTVHRQEQELAARIAAQLVLTAHPQDADEVALLRRTIDGLHACSRREEFPRGVMAISTAQAASHPSTLPERHQALAEEFLAQLGTSPHAIELLEALSWIGASPSAPIDLRMQLGMKILSYLDTEAPERLAQEYTTPDGLRVVIGAEADAFTSLLPAVLGGLERILLSPGLTETYQERLIGRMMEKWNEVIRYQVVWGPANVVRLAEALAAYARTSGAIPHLRVKILEALRQKILNVTIVRLLGPILSAGGDGREMLRHCEEIALQLLEMSRHPDFGEREDQLVLMGSLAQIAARKVLCNDKKKVEPLRRRIADTLISSWSNGTPAMDRCLGELLASEAVPRMLKKKIERRMGRGT